MKHIGDPIALICARDESAAKEAEDKPVETGSVVVSPNVPPNADIVNVKFLSQVQKFIDAQLKVHGPFEPGDIAEVPLNIADVLIKKGSAEIN